MKKIILLIVAAFISTPTWAATSPLGAGLVDPLQFPPSDFDITGLRLSLLWGHHRSVNGLDLGLIGNITELESTGIPISGVFNYTKGDTTALITQFAGLTNVNTNKFRVYGVQLAAGGNFNYGESSVVGFQVAALANHAPFTKIYGVQLGLYNRALTVYGLQIGLVNFTENLHGIQIGLLNFNHTGLFVVSPFLNIGF